MQFIHCKKGLNFLVNCPAFKCTQGMRWCFCRQSHTMTTGIDQWESLMAPTEQWAESAQEQVMAQDKIALQHMSKTPSISRQAAGMILTWLNKSLHWRSGSGGPSVSCFVAILSDDAANSPSLCLIMSPIFQSFALQLLENMLWCHQLNNRCWWRHHSLL